MGKRGPKNKTCGYGQITPKGYRRIYHNGRQQMEHRVVWENHNGAIPDGYQVHHIDGNKLNNDISNLELVNPKEHKDKHSGVEWINGERYKTCKRCGEQKHQDEYYFTKEGWILSECKSCRVRRSVEYKRKRKQMLASDIKTC